MTKPNEPAEEPATPQPEPKKKRPTREEELEYFRKAAELDIAVGELFAKRTRSCGHLAACP